MTPLRKKMIDDMVLRGLSERTQRRYVDAVAGLAKFYNCSPDTLNDEQVQRYLLHLRQERGLSASSSGWCRLPPFSTWSGFGLAARSVHPSTSSYPSSSAVGPPRYFLSRGSIGPGQNADAIR